MAVSTANTILSYSTDGTVYTKLVDIISYPDMGSTPSKLDTTDLTATQFKTYIFGLQEVPDLAFECNYDKATYATIEALTSSYDFKLAFGTADGAVEWSGQIRIFINGGGVDEVRKMTVILSAETELEFVSA